MGLLLRSGKLSLLGVSREAPALLVARLPPASLPSAGAVPLGEWLSLKTRARDFVVGVKGLGQGVPCGKRPR